MKKAIAVVVLLASAMFTFQPATADSETVPAPVSVVEEVITAPVVDLPVDEPVVTTEPAPVVVEAPVTVPEPAPVVAEPVVEAPVEVPAPVVVVPEPVVEAPAPVEVPVTVPEVIMEDDPRWNCETMGNKVCGPAPTETLDNWLDRVCAGPQLGDAYAGIMRNCHWQEAVALVPTLTFLGSGFEADQCASYWIPSVKYPGIIHSYTDGVPSSNAICNAP